MFTEFIPAAGLIRDARKSVEKLELFDYERPIGIQLYGADIEEMKRAGKMAEEAGPDLIDINYGCPVKKVACKGAGAGLLQDIPKMARMTEAVVKSTKLPVTVKTRLGWDDSTKNIVEVAERLQDAGIAALTIHGRTRSQLYKGPADWSLIGEVKNNPRIRIPVFGNGDVDSPERALEMKKKYGVDGVMIGRASIGYPWIFDDIRHFIRTGEHRPPPSLEVRTDVCRIHLRKSCEWKGEKVGVLEMRRHYGNYFKGLVNGREFRNRLVSAGTPDEVEIILDELRKSGIPVPTHHPPAAIPVSTC